MTQPPRNRLPSPGEPYLPTGTLNQELADAFSNAVFGLLEHNCSCPSAKFVRLLVKYRKDMFKGGQDAIPGHDITQDGLTNLSNPD